MAFPLLLVLSLATTAVTMQNQKVSAEAQADELERQAEEEQLSAEGRERQLWQRLNKILSANIVGQSMSGMTGEGTPESIALSNARTASLSEGLESLSDRLRQAQIKRQAASARTMGKVQATSTLLKGVSQAEQLS